MNFKKIKKRIRGDNGDASIVLGLMILLVLMMVGGVMLDFSKAQSLKSAYTDAAKKATQSAIMEQNSRGYLKLSSVSKAVVTYENLTRAYSVNKEGILSKCSNYGPESVDLRITLTEEDGTKKKVTIKRSQIPTVKDAVNPANEVSLKSAERAVESLIINQIYPKLNDELLDYRFKPVSLQINLTEGTENIIFPAAFEIGKFDGNMKCQKLDITAKASTFYGEENDKYN